MTRRARRSLALVAAVASVVLVSAVFMYAGGPSGNRRVSKARWAKAAWTPLARRQVADLFGGPGLAVEACPHPSNPFSARFVLHGADDFCFEPTGGLASPWIEYRVWSGTESYYIVGFEGDAARYWFQCPMRDERAGWLQRQLERFDR